MFCVSGRTYIAVSALGDKELSDLSVVMYYVASSPVASIAPPELLTLWWSFSASLMAGLVLVSPLRGIFAATAMSVILTLLTFQVPYL